MPPVPSPQRASGQRRRAVAGETGEVVVGGAGEAVGGAIDDGRQLAGRAFSRGLQGLGAIANATTTGAATSTPATIVTTNTTTVGGGAATAKAAAVPAVMAEKDPPQLPLLLLRCLECGEDDRGKLVADAAQAFFGGDLSMFVIAAPPYAPPIRTGLGDFFDAD